MAAGQGGAPALSEHLTGSIAYWAKRWPDRLAAACGSQRLTWGELERRSDEIAAGLAAAGVAQGDSVGILMRNRLEFLETLFGAFKAGAAAVLLNIRYTATEMLHPIEDARVKLVVAERALLPALDRARAAHPSMRVFVTEPVEGLEHIDALRLEGAAAPQRDLRGDDIALICYTSGTTGTPKGAMISHRSIHSGSAAKSMIMALNYDDRVLLPMPMAYTGGMLVVLRDSMIPGATLYATTDASAEELLRLIETEKITIAAGVAVLFEMMMNHPNFAATDLSSLRHASCGGAAVTLHLLKTWQARGIPLAQGYGQTESAGTYITLLFPDEAEHKIGFAGRPLPHISLKIVDADNRELPPNEAGEILVRTPAVMSGYLNLPEQTAQAFDGEWLRTGDIGFLDAEGYLKLVDRAKDMLISGGLNVYPAELEKALGDIAGLEEFAVIGVADDRWGEVPMVVVPDVAQVDIEALRARCQSDLADYKRPKYVAGFGQPLPRTFSGKITKQVLRETFPTAPADAVRLKG